MAEALIGGILSAKLCTREQICATDPSAPRRELMGQRFGIRTGNDNAEAVAWADVVILAVKPQVCDAVLAGLRPGLSRQLMISIAAGIRLSWLQSRVSQGVRLIRVMPNAPALVGAGMSALAPHTTATAEDTAFALRLCGAVGRAVVVEEAMLDAVTGLSGSGPAFAFVAMEALADGGVKAGLPRVLAERLAAATALGAATLALDRPAIQEAAGLSTGPVQAGLDALQEGCAAAVMAEAVVAAARRSQELGE